LASSSWAFWRLPRLKRGSRMCVAAEACNIEDGLVDITRELDRSTRLYTSTKRPLVSPQSGSSMGLPIVTKSVWGNGLDLAFEE
jgi:hypothetical protein